MSCKLDFFILFEYNSKLFFFYYILIHNSPNVSGSWTFANIDVIPSTGIMAFGIVIFL